MRLPRPLLLFLFAAKLPKLIISYADVAALMLANTVADSAMAQRRVGIALPLGMRGKKNRSAAKLKSVASWMTHHQELPT